MPSVDVADELFIAAPPATVAVELATPEVWRRLWPDLQLEVVTDRGELGVRWTVHGALVGSMELWLEPVLDGTVLHYFLRADPPDAAGQPAPLRARRAAREVRKRQLGAKAVAFELKDRLEGERPPGEPPSCG